MSLRIVDLRHTVGAFTLTADLVAEPGITVLFGRSGSGKSTLLRCVAGLATPAAGRITLHGRTLTDIAAGTQVRAQERRVGMVFQEPLLLPHRTALANVTLAVRRSGAGDRASRRAAALRWLERVGAADLAQRRPPELSGGQQQRVALARALAGRPELLLLDEPFSSLDADARHHLGALVRSHVDEARLTAVLVTHDRAELRAIADRVALADAGRVSRAVPPEIALRRSEHDDDRAA